MGKNTNLVAMLSAILAVSSIMAYPVTVCSSQAEDNVTMESQQALTQHVKCKDPRPQVCTREYRPVCATLEDCTQKTYPNGCTACSDPKVMCYSPGECKN